MIKPLGKRVLVRIQPNEEKVTDTGLYIPDTNEENRTLVRATIEAVGNEVPDEVPYDVGSVVIFGFWKKLLFDRHQPDLAVVEIDDLLCVEEDE